MSDTPQRRPRIGRKTGLALLLVGFLSWRVKADEPASPANSTMLMDEIVAVVDDKFAILWSDLFLEARILSLRQEGPAAFLATPDAKALSNALDHLIDERVVRQEADRLQVFLVGATEIDRAVQDLRQAVGPKVFDQFLTEKQIDEFTIREIVERGLRSQRYLEGRFGQASRPKDAEVEAWFANHKDEFARQTPDKAKAEIRERLTRERFSRLVKDFTADVRRRARVRLLHDPSEPDGELRMSGTASAPRPSAADAGQG